MKKKSVLVIIIFFCIVAINIFYYKINYKIYKSNNKINQNQISYFLETGNNTNIYNTSSENNYPSSSNYTLNLTKSYCLYGSQLQWDTENNKVVMTSDHTDKCFLYFDVFFVGISINTPPTTTTYNKGTSFSTTGMVIKANYSDGSSKTIDSYTYTPTSALTINDTNILISYTEDDITKTVSQPITVLETWKKYAILTNTYYDMIETQVGTYTGNALAYEQCYSDNIAGRYCEADSRGSAYTNYSFNSSEKQFYPAGTSPSGAMYAGTYYIVYSNIVYKFVATGGIDVRYTHACVECTYCELNVSCYDVTRYNIVAQERTTTSKGDYIEDVHAVIGTYPDDGVSNGYWYVKQ